MRHARELIGHPVPDLPSRRPVLLALQIASALLYIHSKKILHRDLKSQNIFIARGGIMVLGDFGISKVLERTDQFAHTVTGTPYYM